MKIEYLYLGFMCLVASTICDCADFETATMQVDRESTEGFEEFEGISSHVNAKATEFCLKEHNIARAKHNLTLFIADSRLETSAKKHNAFMKAHDCFKVECENEPSLGKRISNEGYKWSSIAENIALGYPNCAAVVNAWMQSASKNNILGNYVNIGCHHIGKLYTCDYGKERK